MNQEKIIQAIADVINKKGTDDFGMLPWCKPSDLIAELAAAIAPHLEAGAGWENAPSWAEWLASNNKGLLQWFEDKPIWDNDLEHWLESTEDGRYKFAGKLAKGKELIQRPR